MSNEFLDNQTTQLTKCEEDRYACVALLAKLWHGMSAKDSLFIEVSELVTKIRGRYLYDTSKELQDK